MASNITAVLVDTEEKVKDVVDEIREFETLSVDCEGVDLGRDGELCLVQIATTEKVYLLDICELKGKAFETGLKEIFEDEKVTKLFFDCREDCNALKHLYGINVKGMQDIQILKIIDMKLGGRRWQCVTGLQKCMAYNLPGCGFSQHEKERIKQAMSADRSLWKKRPLTKEFINYAAYDVFFLARLRATILSGFPRYGPPRDAIIELLKYSTERYADFMRDNPKYQRDGKYFRTARLPERIIPEIMTSGTAYTIEKFTDTTGAHCTTCHQRTDCRPDGQCNRCYMIDNPAVFERQYGAPRKRRYIFDNGPSSKFYRY